ncbi:MAG: aldehyde ferredoxin oxidoreductase family protein [Deltaproteobacteria bacterium]|nr:aldehyde ferredoxin oxidoreductase family protein [Deltaproteobacteria bacterium]
MKGFANSIIRIDLSTGDIKKEKINEEWARDYIGGRGLAGKMLYEEVGPKVDPLSNENKIFFALGPLAGTGSPSGNRVMTVTKSPLNNTLACSNAGGFWGLELKRAGYDMVILEGKSEKPVFISIIDDDIKIEDASSLWGLSTSEVTDKLEEKYPKSRSISIGPAGEKLSLISSVMIDKSRASGRTGVGAVMGSKMVKAIVVKATKPKKPEIYDSEAFKKARETALKKLKENPVASQGLPSYGTAVLVNIINNVGGFPYKNAQDAYMKDAEKISGEYLAEHYLTKNKACAGCPIVCGRVTKVESGSFKSEGEGPEYETIWSLGAMCGINDMEAIIKAHHLCDFFGLDGIATGSTIACAMELFEKGYIKKDEVGFDLVFGNGEAMVKAVELIGKREGFGDKMALGSYRLAESYGHPELSMSVKKQEFPAYDPRAIKGIGLEYATSNRGACHVRGYTIAAEVLAPEPVDRLSYDGKAELAILFQNLTAVVDSSGTCLFTTFGMELSDFANLLKSATGFDYDEKSALLAGERIWNLERLWNIEVGYTKDDDTLPERMLKESIQTGPSKGEVTDISKMLPEYYRLRGWDENGIPTDTKKKELGISQ